MHESQDSQFQITKSIQEETAETAEAEEENIDERLSDVEGAYNVVEEIPKDNLELEVRHQILGTVD